MHPTCWGLMPPLSAPCFRCPGSQCIPLPWCLERLQQDWPGPPPPAPISPLPEPATTGTSAILGTGQSWEQGAGVGQQIPHHRQGAAGPSWAGQRGCDPMAAWVTSVTGVGVGTEGDSCRQLPGGSSRAWGRRVRGLPGEQGWAGRSPGRDPAPPAGQPPAQHPATSRQRDHNHQKGVYQGFRVLLSQPSLG